MSHSTTDAGTVSARTASRVIILCGVPGAGKTYYAERLRLSGVPFVAVSYFDDPSVPRFDVPADDSSIALVNAARGLCMRRFVEALRDGDGCTLVVDNCNISYDEMLPYICLASAYSVSSEIRHVRCNPRIAAARNVHGVSHDIVMAMHNVLEHTFADLFVHMRPNGLRISSATQEDIARMPLIGVPGSACPTCLGHCVDECYTCDRIGIICDGCDGCRDGCLCALPEEHADMLAHLPRPPVAARIASIR